MPPVPPAIPSEVDRSNINNFLTVLSRYGGPGTFSRFYATITPPAGMGGAGDIIADLSYLCEVAEFPGKQLKTSEVHIYGPSFHIPFQVEYDTIDLTFLCRDFMTERYFFDEWMDLISPVYDYDIAYPETYWGEVAVYQVTHTNASYYKFNFEKAYPVAIAKQPLLWAEEQIQRLTVTFMYNNWSRTAIEY